jgi:endonuclease/exonuclease/phosphatase family metal-dependent hydrolase
MSSAVRSLVLLVVVSAISGCGGDVASTRSATPPAAAGDGTITIASYNVNFGLAGDWEGLLAILETNADVVFLQETTPAWEQSLRGEHRIAGRYRHVLFHHSRGAGGLAVLSRHPIASHEIIEGIGGWFPAMRLTLETPHGPLQALNVHLHPPVSDEGSWVVGWFTTSGERLAEIERFHAALDPALPTIIAGDFNEPDDGAAIRFLAERGLVSALAAKDPDRRTWHWDGPLGELSMQLDHVVLDRTFSVTEARVVERGRSDHFPLVVIAKIS